MSLRSGSAKASLLVAMLFCLGIGLGAGWKLGWIPLELTFPSTGSLEDVDQPTADDFDSPREDSSLAESEDEFAESQQANEPNPVWLADQSEPPVREGINERVIPTEETELEEGPEPDNVPVIRAEPSAKKRTSKRRDLPMRRVKPANYETESDAAPKTKSLEAEFDELVEKPSSVSVNRFQEVDEKLAAGELLAAHKLLSKMYWGATRPDAELQTRIDESAKKIFFSSQQHFIEPHVVQSGDQLRKIAGKYHLSWEYLAALNRTDPRRIREGQKLKVLNGPFSAIVNLRDFSLTLHLQGYYVKRYLVGIGKDSSSPIGKFTVLEKIEDPQYTDPDGKVIPGGDPTNPLGKRWLDLGDSYGIHGTIDPDSIGKAESRGCIRLKENDIIEVYNFLVKGSSVEIRE